MHEFTCAYCGTVKQVRFSKNVGIYCGRTCAAKDRKKRRSDIRRSDVRRSDVREICTIGECVFQPESIMCGKRECENCGWNPVVAKARLEAIVKGYNAEPKIEHRDKFGAWISCEERLPKERVQVLAYTHTGKVMSLHCENGFWKARDNIQITHWMPMPDAPKEG